MKNPKYRTRFYLLYLKVMFFCIIVSVNVGCANHQKKILPNDIGNESDYLVTGSTSVYDKVHDDSENFQMTAQEHEQLGDASLKKGRLYIAFKQYEKALEKDRENIRLEYKKGLTLLLAKKYDDAIKQFKIVLNQDTEHAFSYLGIGTAYFKKKDYINGEIHLHTSAELNPSLWKAHNLLGNIYDRQKKYAMAISEYQKAIAINPYEGALDNNLGVSYTLYGDHENAVQAFESALRKKYCHEKVYNNLGIALSNLQKYDEAFSVFKKSLGEAPAYNNLGCIYMKLGKREEAIRCFEKAIEVNPRFYQKASDNLKKMNASRFENGIFPAS